jgi:AraC-like DNA-binding protein
MMPKLDGIEMCNLLQNDSHTNHIPIILITAKNSSNSKIQGLKSGAVEFINKPFNTTELRLKIKNIITSKEYIISKIKKEAICNPSIDPTKTQDEIFLENLVQEINIHIEDTNFKMHELASSLSMSYSTLHRKCQSVTGKNLVDFIRSYRLKKGAIIIANNGNTVSESAFMVGFNDPKYFSKCFKKEFGLTPLKFRKEAMIIGSNKYLKKYNLD